MRAYWDTSALAKLYVQEAGSEAARKWQREYEVTSSRILGVEIHGLVRRRSDERLLSTGERKTIDARLAADRHSWLLLDVATATLEHAEKIAATQRVRALDAIHLATAAVVVADWPALLPFLTADRRQYEAARALGLAAELLS